MLALLLADTPTYGLQIAAASLGGIAVAGTLLVLARRTDRPERILLAGIALGALFSAVLTILMAGATLTIPARRVTGLIGHNGSGKSTLLNFSPASSWRVAARSSAPGGRSQSGATGTRSRRR